MTHVYTLANAKGGCGKSTVALNLAVCFARLGHRTLAVDLDQQGNLSAALGTDLNKLNRTAHRLLIDDQADISSFLSEPRPRLNLLPNTIDVEADDLLEAKKVNRELLLRRKLRPVLRDFDIIVIDTPPAMRAATLNGLAVADTVLIPVDGSSYFALLGLNQLLQVVAAVREAHKPDMQQTVVNVLKARGRVRDLPGYALRTVYRELRRLHRLEWLCEQRETTAERFGLQPDLGSETQPYRRVLALQLLSKLKERDQILVRLYAEEYPWEYIGPIVGLSPQSAKQRCYRLLRRLREITTQEPTGLAASHRTKRS